MNQDQTSSRPNTLFDDADDIQRQLDNEARDRIKYGRPKTIWVFHIPTHFPDFYSADEVMKRWQDSKLIRRLRRQTAVPGSAMSLADAMRNWEYKDQHLWYRTFPDCGGRSQSPVDIPVDGLIKARGARRLLFCNYNILPRKLTVQNDGQRVILSGEWISGQKPLIYGGAAHSRRYLFHSLIFHWPSEHTIGGLQYPLESQALHISAEYNSLEEALEASPSDPQAFLAISSMYKYGNHTQAGLKEVLKTAIGLGRNNGSAALNPLSFFCPPFKEYACYQGSLTTPPCTESVLWLVRGRTLTVLREAVEAAYSLLSNDGESHRSFFRQPLPLNDRKIFYFH